MDTSHIFNSNHLLIHVSIPTHTIPISPTFPSSHPSKKNLQITKTSLPYPKHLLQEIQELFREKTMDKFKTINNIIQNSSLTIKQTKNAPNLPPPLPHQATIQSLGVHDMHLCCRDNESLVTEACHFQVPKRVLSCLQVYKVHTGG